jgi:hypothetical protein
MDIGHRTYRRLADLVRDSGLTSIEIFTARKTGYCVQTSVLGSWAHYAGPSGTIRAANRRAAKRSSRSGIGAADG